MKTKFILGQEVICPDGYGRISEINYGPANTVSIKVNTYVNNRGCIWAEHNIKETK